MTQDELTTKTAQKGFTAHILYTWKELQYTDNCSFSHKSLVKTEKFIQMPWYVLLKKGGI